ncbi:hypothetical protein CBS12448_11080 [Aspergillus niger]|nr:hypothetical protein CBS12448_11080 [Aspergillus niger]
MPDPTDVAMNAAALPRPAKRRRLSPVRPPIRSRLSPQRMLASSSSWFKADQVRPHSASVPGFYPPFSAASATYAEYPPPYSLSHWDGYAPEEAACGPSDCPSPRHARDPRHDMAFVPEHCPALSPGPSPRPAARPAPRESGPAGHQLPQTPNNSPCLPVIAPPPMLVPTSTENTAAAVWLENFYPDPTELVPAVDLHDLAGPMDEYACLDPMLLDDMGGGDEQGVLHADGGDSLRVTSPRVDGPLSVSPAASGGGEHQWSLCPQAIPGSPQPARANVSDSNRTPVSSASDPWATGLGLVNDQTRTLITGLGTHGDVSTLPEASSLTVPLLEHQEQGLRWMIQMEESHWHGGILADDMGLGKTVQALALVAAHPPSSPDRRATLVVAPAGLVPQWKQEIERLLPPDPRYPRVRVYHRTTQRATFDELARYRVVLTTFNTVRSELRRRAPDSPLLGLASKWHRVILDEAQCIKNSRSKAAIACDALDASYRWCLSGTPVMNHAHEFDSLLRFLRVHPCRGREDRNVPANDPGSARCRRTAPAQLQALAKDIMLRRTKKSTLNGQPIISLPAKHEATVYVTFGPEEQRLYAALESRTRHYLSLYLHGAGVQRKDMLGHVQRLRQACCHPFLIPPIALVTDQRLATNARGFEDAVVARLQGNESVRDCPICLTWVDNPLLCFPCGHSLCGDCFERIAADGRPVRCPSCRQDLDLSCITDYASFTRCHYAPQTDRHSNSSLAQPVSLAGPPDWAHRGGRGDGAAASADPFTRFGLLSNDRDDPGDPAQLAGLTPRVSIAAWRKQAMMSQSAWHQYQGRLEAHWVSSAKVDQALAIVDAVLRRGQGEKTIVFSQFVSMLDLLAVPLAQQGQAFERYDGGLSLQARGAALANFSRRPDCNVLLMSLKAGNAGLNLACASEVILLDPSWNPYVEEQAVGRVHRIGQQRPVRVHRILVKDTIEDRILELQDSKRHLIQGILGEEAILPAGDPSRLEPEDLAYLLGLQTPTGTTTPAEST